MYGLRGYDGRVYGLGVLDYYDLLAQAGLQNCDPRDSACVSNNAAKEAAVEDFWAAHQATGVPDDTVLQFTPQTPQQVKEFWNPDDILNGGNVVDTRGILQVSGVPASWLTPNITGSPSPTAPVYHPSVSFNTSRGPGASALYPGDTWSITITGGAPNAAVTVSGSDPAGSYVGTSMGKTDANGNFTLSGTIDASQLGNWSEQWSVGGASAGTISFSVKSAPASSGGSGSGGSGASTSQGNAPSGSSSPPAAGSGFSLSDIPWWGWAGGAAAALFMLGGKR
jgi:hypothetical protein